MLYCKLVLGVFVTACIVVFGIFPLAAALILSFLTLDVIESFSVIYGQWNWLGIRVITTSLFLASIATAAS